MDISNGIAIKNGIIVDAGISASSGFLLPPEPVDVFDAIGTIIVPDTGTNQSIVLSAADTFSAINFTSQAQGDLIGLTSANDCSFTNASGKTLNANGRIIAYCFGTNIANHLGAQSDESGSWTEIQANTGGWRGWHYQANGVTVLCCDYQISLSDGKSTRPVIENDDVAQTVFFGKVIHQLWSRN